MVWFLKKSKIEWSSNIVEYTSEYIPKGSESRMLKRCLCIHIHSFIIPNSQEWKQPRCPSVDERINKMWKIHTMEYYPALTRREILTHATTWMNLENITLSEISQSLKTNMIWFCLSEVPRVVRYIETESRVVVARCCGVLVGVSARWAQSLSFGRWKMFWTWQWWCGYATMSTYLCHQTEHFK